MLRGSRRKDIPPPCAPISTSWSIQKHLEEAWCFPHSQGFLLKNGQESWYLGVKILLLSPRQVAPWQHVNKTPMLPFEIQSAHCGYPHWCFCRQLISWERGSATLNSCFSQKKCSTHKCLTHFRAEWSWFGISVWGEIIGVNCSNERQCNLVTNVQWGLLFSPRMKCFESD